MVSVGHGGAASTARAVAGTTDRRLSIDILKIVMALCVIAIHVNPLESLPNGGAFLHGGLARVAVPVFFLINGYFFETIARNGGARAYVVRLLWLFAVWSILYLPAWFNALLQPDLWPLARFTIMGWWHLWYLPGLALAAALAARMQHWPEQSQVAAMALTFGAGVAIVYGIAFGVLHPSPRIFGDMTVLHRNGLFLGLPFLLGGMLIRRHDLENSFSLPVLAVAAAAGLALMVAEGIALRQNASGLANHDNLAALAVACPAILLFALKLNTQSRSRTVGTYANGLYFLHVAFCVIGFRYTDLPSLQIFCLAVAGSIVVTAGLIRTGLARRLL